MPLAVSLSAANRNDISELIPLVDGVAPVRGKRGRPRRRPKKLLGDRAYYSKKHHRELRCRRITPKIAKPNSSHGSGLGRERWVVERSISWLHQQRRLRVRYERRADIHEALLQLGASLICFKQLQAAASL